MATVIGPKGFLYTFEFNQDRAIKAQHEFDNLGFTNIKVTWRDACGDGFVPKEGDDYKLTECDAVFLDLPKPWDAIGHASKVLKKGGRICCFSPCIEQVQKTCLELKKQNYLEVRSFECIGRHYERKKNFYRSLGQGNSNKRKGKELEDEKGATKKEKLENQDEQKGEVQNTEQQNEQQEQNIVEEEKEQEQISVQPASDEGKKSKTQSKAERKEQALKEKRNESFFTSGSQFTQGHTGYLTFAIKS